MEAAIGLFKALADESRLRIIGLLANDECSVEELSTRLELTPPTVSHHLTRLKETGLVSMRSQGTSHLYRLDTDALRTLSKDLFSPERIAALTESESRRRAAAGEEAGDPWEQKVLRDYFEGERLRQIPTQFKKRWVILGWLANRFDARRRYSEREVNEIIKEHHEDYATLRRHLVADGFMQRERGVYWRLPSPPFEA
jgi:hypothetical protein